MKNLFFTAIALVAFSTAGFAGNAAKVKKNKTKTKVVLVSAICDLQYNYAANIILADGGGMNKACKAGRAAVARCEASIISY